MPEPTPEVQPPVPGAPAQQPAPQPDGEDAPLGAPGLKALQAERDARAVAEKERDALQDQVDKFQQANLSEIEREKAAREKAEAAALTERAEKLRLQAAIEFGIPKDYLDLLTATDEKTLKSQAEKVAALVKTSASQTPLPGQGSHQTAPGSGQEQARDQLRKRGLVKAD